MILSIFLISFSILILSRLPEDHSKFLILLLASLRAFLASSTCLLISLRSFLNSIALFKFSFNDAFNSSRILRCSLAILLNSSLSSVTLAISASFSSFCFLTPSMVSAKTKSDSGRPSFLGFSASSVLSGFPSPDPPPSSEPPGPAGRHRRYG